MISINK